MWSTDTSYTLVYYYVREYKMQMRLTQLMHLLGFYRAYAGLAYYISIKRAPERIQILKSVYEEEFQRAMSEDANRHHLS